MATEQASTTENPDVTKSSWRIRTISDAVDAQDFNCVLFFDFLPFSFGLWPQKKKRRKLMRSREGDEERDATLITLQRRSFCTDTKRTSDFNGRSCGWEELHGSVKDVIRQRLGKDANEQWRRSVVTLPNCDGRSRVTSSRPPWDAAGASAGSAGKPEVRAASSRASRRKVGQWRTTAVPLSARRSCG